MIGCELQENVSCLVTASSGERLMTVTYTELIRNLTNAASNL